MIKELIIRHWKIPFHVLGIGQHLPALLFRRLVIAVLLFSATFRLTDVIRNSSGCKTSTNFISAVETRRLPSCSCSADVGALGDSGLHEGSTPDLVRTTSLDLGLKGAEGKHPGRFSDWDFCQNPLKPDLHGKVLF